MNKWADEGGAAFPVPKSDASDGECGMSLLDYFAGQALCGGVIELNLDDKEIAEKAYRIAKLMLSIRRSL
jgi:hypothetical protein